jgi:MarR family transcriptional regulator, lower aerobic nicotinate degradation pathway regulator
MARGTRIRTVGNGYVLEQQVGHLLRRAYQRHVAIFQGRFGEDGPTSTQFAALFTLWRHGGLSQNRLGRLIAMDPATIKGVIARLEERGLVERGPDPEDRRRVRLALSAAGRAAMPRLVERARKVTEATVQPLSPREAARLAALLRRIV